MLNGLIGGLLAATITMLGWFVTDYLRRKEADEKRVADFVERQIVELYAPLYFMAESEFRYRQMRDKAVELAQEEKKHEVWWAYSEKFIVPLQTQIYDLLKSKWHLTKEGEVHQSTEEVIRHCTDALSLFTLAKQGITINTPPAQPMPNAFVTDIKQDLEELRRKYDVAKKLKPRHEQGKLLVRTEWPKKRE